MDLEQGRDQVSGIVQWRGDGTISIPCHGKCAIIRCGVHFYGLSFMWHVQMCRLLSVWMALGDHRSEFGRGGGRNGVPWEN